MDDGGNPPEHGEQFTNGRGKSITDGERNQLLAGKRAPSRAEDFFNHETHEPHEIFFAAWEREIRRELNR